MNSEVIYRLARASEVLRDDLSFSKAAMTNLLNFGKYCSPIGAILQLLCIGREKLIKAQQSPNEVVSLKIFLEQALLCVAPFLEANPLLKYLTTRRFQQFDSICKTSEDLQQRNLLIRSHGLYPPFTPNGLNSVFSRYSQQKPLGGNPHWALSRYALAQWFFLNKNKLNHNIRQIYTFLLSQQEFIDQSKGFLRLWALLYCNYTQIVLEQALKDSEINDNRFITWKVSPFEHYQHQLLKIEDRLSGYFKVIYYLILDQLLCMQPQRQIHNRYFQLAFATYSNVREKVTEWDMLAYTLFLKMSQIKQNNKLRTEICQKVRLLFEMNEFQGLSFFQPLYFDFSDLLTKILEGRVNYQELNLSGKEKNQVAIYMLCNNKMDQNLLKYLSPCDIYSIFQSKQWQDLKFANTLLPLLDQHRNLFVSKLQIVLGNGVQERIIQHHLETFRQVWSAYCLIQQQQQPEQAALVTVSLQKQMLRQTFHFMVVPRDFSKAVLTILMGYARYFNKNRLQMKTGGPALKHFRQFQEEELPGWLSVLDENQRNQFWKEWGELLRSDPEFVQDILHPQEPSTEA